MQAFAIPRIDLGAEGIEVLWTWPDTLPLSVQGYDILRLGSRDARWASICETIGQPEITRLRAQTEITAPLGPLRLRTDANVRAISKASLAVVSLAPGDQPAEVAQPQVQTLLASGVNLPTATPLAVAPLAAAFVGTSSAVGVRKIEEYIQELDNPTDRATVLATASAVLVVALARGKAVATGLSGAAPTQIVLAAAGIDTIVVYAIGLSTMTICTSAPAKEDVDPWASAVVVARGLTLPIDQADSALSTPALEFAAAKSRLLGTEALDAAQFARATATLRSPSAATTLGRSGARLSLNRSDATQSYEEMPLDQQLAALVLHPKARRVLGFGHNDRNGLAAGSSYLYRVIGRFDAADVTDAIYDVHRIPASTVLPASFWIRDIAFRFQTPVKVVLGPARKAQRRRMGCFASHARQSSGPRSWNRRMRQCGTCHTALPVVILARRAVCKSFASQMISCRNQKTFRTFNLRFTHRSFVKTIGHWLYSSSVSRQNDDRYGAISVNLSEITTQSRDLGRRIPQWGKPLQRAVKPAVAPIRQPQLVGGLVLSLRNE